MIVVIPTLILILILFQHTSDLTEPMYGGGDNMIDIDTMVFSETERFPEIKNRHIWNFQLPLPLENFKPPSKNSSESVKKELDYLYKLSKTNNVAAQQLAIDMEIKATSVLSLFLKYAGENGLMYHEDHIRKIADDSKTLAYLVKSYYNRSRPYQVAYLYNIPIIPVKLAEVSSYPCEKTLTAKIIAYQLSYNNPEQSNNLHNIAKRIELSRYYGNMNFPSDTKASIELAELLRDRMKYFEAK